MEAIGKFIEKLAKTDLEDGDYYDSEDFVVCGKCNTRKQIEIDWPGGGKRKVSTMCKCRKDEYEQQEAELQQKTFARKMESLRKDGITDPKYLQFNFKNDDMQNKKISDVCRNYVAKWDEMKSENMGVLFTGTVGTGKSFFACCIANALVGKLMPVCVTNFPRILNKLQGLGDDRQAFIDKLQRYQLLVIDDLGVERDTSYSAEQIFNVIDARSRSNLPTIITTNLTLHEMETTTNMQYRRIYDRVLEMCPIRLVMEGESRRIQNANQKRDRALELLRGGDKRG